MGFNGTTAHGNRDLEEDSDFLEGYMSEMRFIIDRKIK